MATDQTGTARSPYDDVTTETLSGEIKAGPHNTSLANLEIAIEAHRHNLNGTVGWDSMKSNFRPPDTGDSSNRWRMVCGTETITYAAGSITVGGTITFATDADQGDPSFTTAPRLLITIQSVTAGAAVLPLVSSLSTTSAGINLDYLETATGTVIVHWIAYGKVA